jgi:spermidine synthase
MNRVACWAGMLGAILMLVARDSPAAVVYEVTSPYHHIQVLDEQGCRILSFDGATQTRMSLRDPIQGHFEYTEYFHMPWLWNTQITNVLMIGLGGGSTQRAYQHYYPKVMIETAEIDPTVVDVAKTFFGFRESAFQRVQVADGRVYLRRSRSVYDVMILDAYVANRYGSFIPYHLATKEFFELANQRLASNGVLAYNVIGTLQDWQADILGSIYKTMKSVFPQVYFFPAQSSLNVVVIGLKSGQRLDKTTLQQRAETLMQTGRVKLPTFRTRVESFRAEPPANFDRCQVLTDDYAPTDGLLSRGR